VIESYEAMRRYFGASDGTSLFRLTSPQTGPKRYAYLWDFSRALLGTLALAGVDPEFSDAANECFRALHFYWDPPAYASYPHGGDRYYDDNAWISLAFIQGYRMGLSSSLVEAERIFSFGLSGWDANAGGVYWVEQTRGVGLSNHDRGCGATFAYAALGFHLHLLCGSPTVQHTANTLHWVDTHLYDRSSGLYFNALRADGSVDTNLWAYNQGTAIAAHLLHHLVTGASLEPAITVAHKALEHFGDFTTQPPSFNVMLFQNLLMLHPHVPPELQTRILHTIVSYADWAWRTARDPHTNCFHFDRAVPAQLVDQGAMTQLYALLAWDPANYHQLT
jgi:hypothetical protein